jgi:membrane protein implicated in regulation of membrane protease activity
MFSWIFDHTPIWLWAVGVGAALAASYSIWLPIVLPIWVRLPAPVKAALIAIVAVISAYLAGRKKGTDDATQRQKDQNAKAIQTRAEIDHEVRTLPDADLKRRGDKWLRD